MQVSSRVSVIIPCYNGERFIDRSIASVYAQDYADLELIVIDDGSTDGSSLKIHAWKQRFNDRGWFLTIINQHNLGSGGAINTGLKHVTGEYLTLLDVDDEFLTDSIPKRAAFLLNHPEYSAVRTNGWIVNQNTMIPFVENEEEKNKSDIFEALLMGKTNNWAGSYMLRTTVLFSFYPDREIYPSRFGQNLQLLLPVSYHQRVGFIDEALMKYNLQPSSLSKTSDNKTREALEFDNLCGYEDIRLHMIKEIIPDSLEQARYETAIQSEYIKLKFELAARYKDKALLQTYYNLLKKNHCKTLSASMLYYSVMCLPFSYLVRIINRVKKALLKR